MVAVDASIADATARSAAVVDDAVAGFCQRVACASNASAMLESFVAVLGSVAVGMSKGSIYILQVPCTEINTTQSVLPYAIVRLHGKILLERD